MKNKRLKTEINNIIAGMNHSHAIKDEPVAGGEITASPRSPGRVSDTIKEEPVVSGEITVSPGSSRDISDPTNREPVKQKHPSLARTIHRLQAGCDAGDKEIKT